MNYELRLQFRMYVSVSTISNLALELLKHQSYQISRKIFDIHTLHLVQFIIQPNKCITFVGLD